MPTSIDARMEERSLLTDQTPSVIEKREAQSNSNRSNNSVFLAPVSPPKVTLADLEFSDIGRDPRFMHGRWLGIAILISVALCAAYTGFISVWAALVLTVVW